VNPSISRGHIFYPPLSLISLAPFLKQNGHEVHILDRNVLNNPFEDMVKKIMPDIVGISSLTNPMISDGLKVAGIVRTITDSPIIWGGIHPSILPFQTIQNPLVDVVCVGEGEYTLLEIANVLEKNKSLKDVRGILYKDKNGVHTNPPRPFMKSPKELPMPAWDLVDMSKYFEAGILTGKGCPYKCTFCYRNIGLQKRPRIEKTADQILDEISHLVHKYKRRVIHIFDDVFTLNKRRVREVCKKIKSERLDIRWICDAQVTNVDYETLDLMKKAGCFHLVFGVESGSQRMLDFIKKGITVSQVLDAFDLCKKVGLRAGAFFMYGLPTETREDLNMTMKLASKLTNVSALQNFKPLPGSELYEFCVKNGLFRPPTSLVEWGDIDLNTINLSEVPIEEINLFRKEISVKLNIKNAINYSKYGIDYFMHETPSIAMKWFYWYFRDGRFSHAPTPSRKIN
jgi:radical SAM superfamily enzyme YgiQ (UPF0313 family)|tara:strand:- start:2275 stop:3642 length:1368 start_codon:yes stop_codon:yes gene_type:complete